MLFPMGDDDEDRIRTLQSGRKQNHEINHRLVACVSENGQMASSMGEETERF